MSVDDKPVVTYKTYQLDAQDHLLPQQLPANSQDEYSHSTQPNEDLFQEQSLFLSVQAYLVSRESRTKHRPHNLWIDVIRQKRQIISIECNVLLETSIFVMQMVCTRYTVLFRSRETKLASTTDPT